MTLVQVFAIAFVAVAVLAELRVAELRRRDKYFDLQPPGAA